MTQLGSNPNPAILGAISTTPATPGMLTPITPIPNRAPAAAAPEQLGGPRLDNNGRPIIPAVPMNVQGIHGVGQSATALGDENLVNFVQNVRKEIVDSYLQQGVIPKGTADKLLLSGMLKDLTDTVMTLRKNEIEAKNGQSAQAIAEMMAAIPKTVPGIAIPGAAPKALPDSVPTAQLVPGEADTEPAQMNIDSFMSGVSPDAPAPDDGKKKTGRK